MFINGNADIYQATGNSTDMLSSLLLLTLLFMQPLINVVKKFMFCNNMSNLVIVWYFTRSSVGISI